MYSIDQARVSSIQVFFSILGLLLLDAGSPNLQGHVPLWLQDYIDEVLPKQCRARVSIEAGRQACWGSLIGIESWADMVGFPVAHQPSVSRVPFRTDFQKSCLGIVGLAIDYGMAWHGQLWPTVPIASNHQGHFPTWHHHTLRQCLQSKAI